MARCLTPDYTNLALNELVYIREIPNMRGHCIVLRNGYPPAVGYHVDRFELVGDRGEEPALRPVGEPREVRWDLVATREDFVEFCKSLAADHPFGWTNDSLQSFLEALWCASDYTTDPEIRSVMRVPGGESWRTFAWLLASARRYPRGGRDPFQP